MNPFGQSSKVISGHGTFNKEYLVRGPGRRDKPEAQFDVPDGVTIYMYAPPGASLDNSVANLIEGASIDSIELVYVDDQRKKKDMPAGYPYRFRGGDKVINYTVEPPDRLRVNSVNKNAHVYTVSEKISLRNIVDTLHKEGVTDIHYACCGSLHEPDNDEWKQLMSFRGYYVRLK